jgi:hypothetical protein
MAGGMANPGGLAVRQRLVIDGHCQLRIAIVGTPGRPGDERPVEEAVGPVVGDQEGLDPSPQVIVAGA